MENNKDLNPIDDLFSSQLGSFEMNTEGDAWAKFENTFPSETNAATTVESEEKEAKVVGFWFSSNFYRAAAAILIMFGLGYYWLSAPPKTEVELATNSPKIEFNSPTKTYNSLNKGTELGNTKSTKQPSSVKVYTPLVKEFANTNQSIKNQTLTVEDKANFLDLNKKETTTVEHSPSDESPILTPEANASLAVSNTTISAEPFTFQLELRPSNQEPEQGEVSLASAQGESPNSPTDADSSLKGKLSKLAPWNQLNSNEIASSRLARLVRPGVYHNEY